MAITKNLTIEQGTTFLSNITVLSDNKVIDLTNYQIYGRLQKSFQTANITAVFGTSVLGNPTNGNVTISLTAGETGNIVPGRYVYSLFGQSNTFVLKISEGTVTINPSALAIGIGKDYVGNVGAAIPNYVYNYINTLVLDQANLLAQQITSTYFLNNTYFQSFTTTLDNFGNILNTAAANIITLNSITTTLQSNVANVSSSISNVITISRLKAIVATSNSWSEFQANIALL